MRGHIQESCCGSGTAWQPSMAHTHEHKEVTGSTRYFNRLLLSAGRRPAGTTADGHALIRYQYALMAHAFASKKRGHAIQ